MSDIVEHVADEDPGSRSGRAQELPPELEELKVIPSYQCARGCFYCYNTLLNQTRQADPLTQRKKLLETMANAPRRLTVEIIGGEPLEPGVFEQTVEYLTLLRGHSRSAKIVVSTAVAASLPLQRILPFVDRVYLSIDASASTRNRKRITEARLRQLAELFESHDVELIGSVVLFGDESADELQTFVDLAVRSGLRAIGFSHRTATSLDLNERERYVDQYYELFRLRLAWQGTIRIGGAMLESLEIHFAGGYRVASCECGVTSMVLEPDGRLGMGICFDNHDYHPDAVNEFRSLKSERERTLKETPPCSTCALWDVCRGGCVGEASQHAGDPMARAPLHCTLLRGVAARVQADSVAS